MLDDRGAPAPNVPVEQALGVLASRIRESRGTDRTAVEDLCRALWPRIHVILCRRERDAATAADLAQDTMLAVIDALREGRVEHPDRIAAFALTVARSLAASAGRTRARREGLVAAMVVDERATMPALDAVDLPQLGRCLNHLPFRERQTVFEAFFLERTAEQTARTLATTASNVRVLRHRAIQALRRCLQLEGAES